MRIFASSIYSGRQLCAKDVAKLSYWSPPMDSHGQDRERVLRAELDEALEAYDRAFEEHERLMGIHPDVAPGSPDSWAALRAATRVKLAATDRYLRALMEFSRCVLGKRDNPSV
jgi:hypothetical protein